MKWTALALNWAFLFILAATAQASGIATASLSGLHPMGNPALIRQQGSQLTLKAQAAEGSNAQAALRQGERIFASLVAPPFFAAVAAERSHLSSGETHAQSFALGWQWEGGGIAASLEELDFQGQAVSLQKLGLLYGAEPYYIGAVVQVNSLEPSAHPNSETRYGFGMGMRIKDQFRLELSVLERLTSRMEAVVESHHVMEYQAADGLIFGMDGGYQLPLGSADHGKSSETYIEYAIRGLGLLIGYAWVDKSTDESYQAGHQLNLGVSF